MKGLSLICLSWTQLSRHEGTLSRARFSMVASRESRLVPRRRARRATRTHTCVHGYSQGRRRQIFNSGGSVARGSVGGLSLGRSVSPATLHQPALVWFSITSPLYTPTYSARRLSSHHTRLAFSLAVSWFLCLAKYRGRMGGTLVSAVRVGAMVHDINFPSYVY